VSAGLGIAWVPRVVTQLQRPGVAYRALPGSMGREAPRCETSLVWRRDAPPAAERFADFIRAALRGERTARGG